MKESTMRNYRTRDRCSFWDTLRSPRFKVQSAFQEGLWRHSSDSASLISHHFYDRAIQRTSSRKHSQVVLRLTTEVVVGRGSCLWGYTVEQL